MPFGHTNKQALTIDDGYVDGVSITHGNHPRKHIWTLAAALDEVTTSSEAQYVPVPTQMPQGRSKSLSL